MEVRSKYFQTITGVLVSRRCRCSVSDAAPTRAAAWIPARPELEASPKDARKECLKISLVF